MKLPEPVAVMDRGGDVYKALPTPDWHPPHTNLYSETQHVIEAWERGCEHEDYWRDRDDVITAIKDLLGKP